MKTHNSDLKKHDGFIIQYLDEFTHNVFKNQLLILAYFLLD